MTKTWRRYSSRHIQQAFDSSLRTPRYLDHFSAFWVMFPWHQMRVPPDWCCPNCKRGLENVDCWCGRQSMEATPRPSNLSKTQKIYADILKKEPFDQMRQRLLNRGQRQLKPQSEYLLQHMGLSKHQVEHWKERRKQLLHSSSLPQLETARSRASSFRSTVSGASSEAAAGGPQDPVVAYMMHGPPSYSPTLAGMASAALPFWLACLCIRKYST